MGILKTKNVVLVILTFLLFSCGNKKQSVNPVVTGIIIGGNKTINIRSNIKSVHLLPDKDGNFKLGLDSLPKGMYTVDMGTMFSINIFLKSGSVLNIIIDNNNIDRKNGFVVSGQYIEESLLLQELALMSPAYNYATGGEYENIYIKGLYEMNPQEFLKFQKDILNKHLAVINRYEEKYSSLDKGFIQDLKLLQLLNTSKSLAIYARVCSRSHPEYNVPENFDDYYKNEIPQNDFKLYSRLEDYKSYVREKYYAQLSIALKEYERESLDYFKAEVDFLDTCSFPEIIINSMYSGLAIGYMRSEDEDVKNYLDSIVKIKVKNKSDLKRFEEFKSNQSRYNDGDMAPSFTLIDIDGKEVKLSDFKGKMVMLDCWATWCGPCCEGLPYFKKLKEKYKGKNIVFIGVSQDTDLSAWKKKVKRERTTLLSGIQTNVTLNKNTLRKDFMIQGIPHYVLIGADGRIIKKDSPRPESKEIYKLIDENLK